MVMEFEGVWIATAEKLRNDSARFLLPLLCTGSEGPSAGYKDLRKYRCTFLELSKK